MFKGFRKKLKWIALALAICVSLYLTVPAFAAVVNNIFIKGTPTWEPNPSPPIVVTGSSEPSGIVILSGNITDTGGSTITQRGFVWSLESHDDPGDIFPNDVEYEFWWFENGEFGLGLFFHSPDDLLTNTDYFGRAYAINLDGYVAYGNEVMFDPKAVTKIDIDVSSVLLETLLPLAVAVGVMWGIMVAGFLDVPKAVIFGITGYIVVNSLLDKLL